jgi:hypothetical protein
LHLLRGLCINFRTDDDNALEVAACHLLSVYFKINTMFIIVYRLKIPVIGNTTVLGCRLLRRLYHPSIDDGEVIRQELDVGLDYSVYTSRAMYNQTDTVDSFIIQ